MRLMDENQFDTIYHEHFSYFSFLTVSRSSRRTACDCSTSRSCPRTVARCASTAATPTTPTSPRAPRPRSCASANARPASRRSTPTGTTGSRVEADKRQILSFLIELKEQGLRIAGYGAPAKGNTLLNYCGIGTRFHRLHVRPQPPQAGSVPPRQPHPDPRPGGAARGPAGRRADPALEPARARSCSSWRSSASGAVDLRCAVRSWHCDHEIHCRRRCGRLGDRA